MSLAVEPLAVDASKASVLNSANADALGAVLGDTGASVALRSDADEQLLLYVPFPSAVKLHSLAFTAPPSHAPRTLKVFINKPHMTFDDVEQGLAYYDESGPRPDVLGFQYLRVMAAVAMASRQMARVVEGASAARGEDAKEEESVLCIGLGTGALPAFLAHHFGDRLRVSVVELDPVVLRAASKALQCDFRFSGGGGAYRVKLADAASHVPRLVASQNLARAFGGRAKLRAIFLDAYNAAGEMPAHLHRTHLLKFIYICQDLFFCLHFRTCLKCANIFGFVLHVLQICFKFVPKGNHM